jgi:hypothetical protein
VSYPCSHSFASPAEFKYGADYYTEVMMVVLRPDGHGDTATPTVLFFSQVLRSRTAFAMCLLYWLQYKQGLNEVLAPILMLKVTNASAFSILSALVDKVGRCPLSQCIVQCRCP